MKIVNIINIILNAYFALLIVYIFATWIPKVDWKTSPWKYLKILAGSYLDIFEKFIPGFGAIIGIIFFKILIDYFFY